MTKSKKNHFAKRIGALEFRRLETKRIEYCLSDHRTKASNLRKSATISVYILGMPVGHLCKDCEKEWTIIWKENSSLCPE